jgi:hypothetical protein
MARCHTSLDFNYLRVFVEYSSEILKGRDLFQAIDPRSGALMNLHNYRNLGVQPLNLFFI